MAPTMYEKLWSDLKLSETVTTSPYPLPGEEIAASPFFLVELGAGDVRVRDHFPLGNGIVVAAHAAQALRRLVSELGPYFGAHIVGPVVQVDDYVLEIS